MCLSPGPTNSERPRGPVPSVPFQAQKERRNETRGLVTCGQIKGDTWSIQSERASREEEIRKLVVEGAEKVKANWQQLEEEEELKSWKPERATKERTLGWLHEKKEDGQTHNHWTKREKEDMGSMCPEGFHKSHRSSSHLRAKIRWPIFRQDDTVSGKVPYDHRLGRSRTEIFFFKSYGL